MDDPWPLVGREHERAALRAAVRAADRHAVVLAGPAGTGKTRLAAEARADADAAGRLTLLVAGSPGASGLPLAALAAVLPPEVLAASELPVLLARAHASLNDRAAGRDLVLVVDDAHLLDDASALLVYQLAATRSAFVLVTLRTGEPVHDAITGLWKDGLATRIDVDPLTAQDVDALTRIVLDGPVADTTLELLMQRSGGNALYLRELITGARAGGVLVRANGLWQIVGDPPTTARLAELIGRRLAGLAEDERTAVELLAEGEPLGVAELVAVVGDATVDRLERRALVSIALEGRRLSVRLGHPLYGEVLRAETSARRRRAIAGRLADLVAATGARRHDDALRIAVWRLAAGSVDDPGLFLTGARIAYRRHDYALTRRLAEAAVAAGGGTDAQLLVATAAALLGDAEAAEAVLDAIDVTAADAQTHFAVQLQRMEILVYARAQLPEAVTLIDAALADPRPCPARTELEFYRHQISFLMGDPGADERVAAIAERFQGGLRGVVLGTHAMNLIGIGRFTTVLDLCAEARDALLAETEPLPWSLQGVDVFEVGALAELGRLDDAVAQAERAYRTTVATRQFDAQSWIGAVLAHALLLTGDAAAAVRWAEQAAGSTAARGRTYFAARAHVEHARAAAVAGDPGTATAAVARAVGTGLGGPAFTAQVAEARGWARAAAGDLRAAAAEFDDAIASARSAGTHGLELSALHARRRIGAPVDAGRAAELGRLVDGPLAAARVAHVRARGAQELLAASSAFAALGARLFAAEAAADAAVLLAGTDSRASAAATRRAQQLADQCPGARTPALRPVTVRHRLTPAEHRVADLAAEGLRSKEIAARLALSARTVDNTLQRVYGKLGITGRGQLADALRA